MVFFQSQNQKLKNSVKEIAALTEQNARLDQIFEPIKQESDFLKSKFQEQTEKINVFLELYQKTEKDWEIKDKNYQQRILELVEKQAGEIKKARLDAVATSKSVNKGFSFEIICPFLKEFKHSIKDLKMLSQPVDFICFSGMEENSIDKIIFIEIKTGFSQLTERQKQIKKAVENKQVFWEEFRPDKLTILT